MGKISISGSIVDFFLQGRPLIAADLLGSGSSRLQPSRKPNKLHNMMAHLAPWLQEADMIPASYRVRFL
jgi:hypothetical protein